MPSPSNFLPTTKSQSVLVYTLNAVLLLNLTVIVVLLAGTGPDTQPYAERSTSDATQATEPERRTTALDRSAERADTPAFTPTAGVTRAISEPMPSVSVQPAIFAQPEAVEQQPADQPVLQPAKQQRAESKPAEQNDAPITFFGVGIE